MVTNISALCFQAFLAMLTASFRNSSRYIPLRRLSLIFTIFPYLVPKRCASQSFGSTNLNICACFKLQCVLVYIRHKTLDMRGKSREIRIIQLL